MRKLQFKIPRLAKQKDFSRVNCVDNCMRKDFSSYVFGFANNDIKRVLNQICKGKAITVPVMILGDSGSGKTYLSSCIMQELQMVGKKCLRETTESCVDRLVRTITHNIPEQSFLEYYKEVDVIIIDEIEGLSNKLSTQKVMIEHLDKLIKEGKCIILMGLRRFEDLSVLVKSGCIVYCLNTLNKSQRKQYVRKILRTSGIQLSKDDIDLIAEQCMGAIVGGLNRLIMATIDERKHGKVYLDSDRVRVLLGAGFYNTDAESE